MVEVPLVRLCYGRSGDKGDVANIGIIARNPAHYPFLRSALTEEVVHRYLAHLVKGTTRRFEGTTPPLPQHCHSNGSRRDGPWSQRAHTAPCT